MREKYVAQLLKRPADFGLTEAKFVHTPQICTGAAVRLRCQYTCAHTRQSDLVPPHAPTADETRRILDEYRFGLMLRRGEPFGERDHRDLWRVFADQVATVERDCAERGYPRAFAVAVGTCMLLHRDDSLRPCEYASKSRPTFEAAGIDIKETLEMIQWHGMVVREEGEPFQLFALVLLD